MFTAHAQKHLFTSFQ